MSGSRYFLIAFIVGAVLAITLLLKAIQSDSPGKLSEHAAQANSTTEQQPTAETIEHKVLIHEPIEAPIAEPVVAPIVTEPSTTPSKPRKRFGVFTDEDMTELNRWQETRGYLNSGRSVDDYQYYDDATLEALANNGDPKAMLLYGRRAWANSADLELARELLINASAHGYTSSLAELGGIHLNLAETAKREGDTAAARDYLISAHAWWETGMIRGDKTTFWSQSTYAPEEPFSDEEKDLIMHRANKIYEDINQRRSELGFADFNNQTPVVIDEVFSHLMQDQ